ncbi:MAG TPA: universal stress protein [Anaerolineales bacterium]
MDNVILIPTNGYEGTWPAIEYGAWVAQVTDAPVVLLGVLEGSPGVDQPRSALDDLLDRASALLKQKGLRFSVERQQGKCEAVVPPLARAHNGLTVLGPFGRPLLKRLIVGRSIHSLLESVDTPLLYVPHACLPLRNLLICVGGLGFEITAEHLAIRLGAASGAKATLLHVAPPIDLDYPTARVERDHWRDLSTTDSLLGRNLRQGLETARAAGMTASIKARQGNVVEEILAELRSADYDLVCMGSPHGFSSLRHLYEASVTDEVAEHATCPVLAARYVPEGAVGAEKNA